MKIWSNILILQNYLEIMIIHSKRTDEMEENDQITTLV